MCKLGGGGAHPSYPFPGEKIWEPALRNEPQAWGGPFKACCSPLQAQCSPEVHEAEVVLFICPEKKQNLLV